MPETQPDGRGVTPHPIPAGMAGLRAASGSLLEPAGRGWKLLAAPYRALVLLAGLLCLVSAFAFVQWAAGSRRVALANAQASFTMLVRLETAQIARSIGLIDRNTELLAAQLGAVGPDELRAPGRHVQDLLDSGLAGAPPVIRLLGLVDRNGDLRRLAGRPDSPHVNLGSLRGFAMARDLPDGLGVFSGPIRSPISGAPAIIWMQRIVAADGGFAGMVVAELDLGVTAQQTLPSGSLSGLAFSLVLADGGREVPLLVARGARSEVTDTVLPQGSEIIGRAVRPFPNSGFEVARDGDNLVGRATFAGTPVRMEVFFPLSGILTQWRDATLEVGGAALGFLALVVLLLLRLGYLFRQDRQRSNELARALRDMDMAQTAGQVGVWVYDPSVRRIALPEFMMAAARGLSPTETVQFSTPTLTQLLGKVHPDDQAVAQSALARLRDQFDIEDFEVRLLCGMDWRWFRFTGAVLDRTAAAEPLVRGTVLDVSRGKAAELAYRGTLHKLITVQEEERMRIASELHDGMGGMALSLSLALDRIHAQAESPALRAEAAAAIRQAAEFSRIVAQAINQLRLDSLQEVGLGPALEELCSGWSRQHEVVLSFEETGAPPQGLALEAQILVYRFTQETLALLGRHSSVTRLSVVLDTHDAALRLCIEENGTAPPIQPHCEAGLALLAMRERLANFGGAIDIELAPGQGSSIFLRLPLAAAEPA